MVARHRERVWQYSGVSDGVEPLVILDAALLVLLIYRGVRDVTSLRTSLSSSTLQPAGEPRPYRVVSASLCDESSSSVTNSSSSTQSSSSSSTLNSSLERDATTARRRRLESVTAATTTTMKMPTVISNTSIRVWTDSPACDRALNTPARPLFRSPIDLTTAFKLGRDSGIREAVWLIVSVLADKSTLCALTV